MQIARNFRKPVVCVVLACGWCVSCSRMPQEVAVESVRALCGSDFEHGEEFFTWDSAQFLQGARRIPGGAFVCSQVGDSDLRVTGLRYRKDSTLQVVEVSGAAGTVEVAVVQEDGDWKTDLFLTEETAFYSGLEGSDD